MDGVEENPEVTVKKEEILKKSHLEILRLIRAEAQFSHSTMPNKLEVEREIKERRKEIESANGIRTLDYDLMGFDEEIDDFEHGHGTENDRRERQGKKPIIRGRGVYCILNDSEGRTNIVDFDNSDALDLFKNKSDKLNKFLGADPSNPLEKTVVLVRGEPINLTV